VMLGRGVFVRVPKVEDVPQLMGQRVEADARVGTHPVPCHRTPFPWHAVEIGSAAIEHHAEGPSDRPPAGVGDRRHQERRGGPWPGPGFRPPRLRPRSAAELGHERMELAQIERKPPRVPWMIVGDRGGEKLDPRPPKDPPEGWIGRRGLLP
jgi:hypothetical protein